MVGTTVAAPEQGREQHEADVDELLLALQSAGVGARTLDLRTGAMVADRVALAIDHELTFEREHSIPETLQRRLLPERLSDLPEVSAGRGVPAGATATVGGDWYDVIGLPDGEVALVMGDVVGSGVQAASVMGQLRGTCRIYAGERHAPAEVVRRLNRFAPHLGHGEMATLAYVALDPSTGAGRLVIAGHLPPLVRSRAGSVHYVDADPGVPLGVQQSARYREHHVQLDDADAVVLYTDALIERRTRSLDEGLDHLAASVAAAPPAPAETCAAVLRTLTADDPDDDVALLVLRRAEASQGDLALRLPAEAGALAHMRRALRRWLRRAGADEGEVHDLTLAASEAAANAVEHAYGPLDAVYELRASLQEGVAEVVVLDFGHWRLPRGANRGRGLLLMRALADEVDVRREQGGTEVRLRRRLGGSAGGGGRRHDR